MRAQKRDRFLAPNMATNMVIPTVGISWVVAKTCHKKWSHFGDRNVVPISGQDLVSTTLGARSPLVLGGVRRYIAEVALEGLEPHFLEQCACCVPFKKRQGVIFVRAVFLCRLVCPKSGSCRGCPSSCFRTCVLGLSLIHI